MGFAVWKINTSVLNLMGLAVWIINAPVPNVAENGEIYADTEPELMDGTTGLSVSRLVCLQVGVVVVVECLFAKLQLDLFCMAVLLLYFWSETMYWMDG